jgi:hypothetical protein
MPLHLCLINGTHSVSLMGHMVFIRARKTPNLPVEKKHARELSYTKPARRKNIEKCTVSDTMP